MKHLLLLLALLAVPAMAEPGDHLRPGEPLPGFERLQEYAGPDGLVLVVFRSADW